ncbi:lamin tail domain-containing protein [Actinokineospora enzanensis]|uniref:lamin tail domain-containing protein n=1 Tax=Actinokineospora enzanensis TaxID=155975 RepID=UPI000477D235|nr:lamin tail domain-containing protein [Actinokineospora enzanensis]
MRYAHIVHVALVATLSLVTPGQNPVKLHSVLATGATGYLELRNTSTAEIDLSGWSVESCVGRTTTTVAKLPAGTSLGPDERLAIAGIYAMPEDPAQISVPAVDGDGYRLLTSRGVLADRVSTVAGSPCREAEAALACATGLVLTRDARSTDTDDNRRDFGCELLPS